MTKALDLGSRRLVNCFDGLGGDDWIPATLTAWEFPPSNYAVFTLDRPDHLGCRNCCIPLPGGQHRLRPLTQPTEVPR